ncbi:hypothetical protein Tco_1533355 [Tanacetum coccineum]
MYMEKIQEVHTTNSGPSFDVEPLEKVHYNDDYNVFANERHHSEQHVSINNTCVVEKVDSNAILDASDMCDNDNQADQNAKECDDEHVARTNLIRFGSYKWYQSACCENSDYPIWEVIQKGNGHVSVSTDINGVIKVLPPKTAEQILSEKRKNARTTLLMDLLGRFSTSSGSNSQRENSFLYITDELMYSFFANQSSGLHLDHEDLEQLDEFDLEEMDLKWQVAIISMRLKKFYKKTGRKLQFDAKEPVGFDKTKLECYNSLGSDTEVTSCSKECVESYAKLKKLYDEQREQLGDASIEIQAYTQALKKMSKRDKFGVRYGDQVHNGVLSYENEVFQSVFDSRSSDVEDRPDREVDNSMFTYGSKHVETLEYVSEPVVVKPKVVSQPKVWSDAPIIEEYESDSDDEYHVKTPRKNVKEQNTYSPSPKADKRDWDGLMSKRKKGNGTGQGENRPVWNNVQRLNHQNKFVPKAILNKTGIFPVNTARQNLFSQAATTSTARKVNIADPL